MCILAPLSNIPKEFSVQDPRLFCLEAGVLRENEKASLQCRRRLVSFVYIWGQRGRAAPRRIAEGFEERS